jgi:hypothetical protein
MVTKLQILTALTAVQRRESKNMKREGRREREIYLLLVELMLGEPLACQRPAAGSLSAAGPLSVIV